MKPVSIQDSPQRQAIMAVQQAAQDRGARLRRVLEDEIWPAIPAEVLGTTITRDEEEKILGIGSSGA